MREAALTDPGMAEKTVVAAATAVPLCINSLLFMMVCVFVGCISPIAPEDKKKSSSRGKGKDPSFIPGTDFAAHMAEFISKTILP
jgi:hypothetical protein